MWPFSTKKPRTLGAVVTESDGRIRIDVRGQTCPGYLLSINRAIATVTPGTQVSIITTYAPCGTDVEVWCKEKGFVYHDTQQSDGAWHIRITT